MLKLCYHLCCLMFQYPPPINQTEIIHMNSMLRKTTYLLLILSFSGSLNAADHSLDKLLYKPQKSILERIVAPPPNTKVKKIAPRKDAADINQQRQELREKELQKITEDANIIANVMLTELATQATGDPKTALTGYGSLFMKYPKAELAQRSMELAMLSPDTLNVAENIYELWLELAPQKTFEQRYMKWQLTALQNKADKAFNQLEALINDPDADDQIRANIFLFVADLVASQPQAAAQHAKMVHRLAMAHTHLPEAAIADIMISAMTGNDKNTIAALHRLAKSNEESSIPTILTLEIMMENAPHILQKFFAQTSTDSLPDIWQKFYIDMLLRSGDADEAYQIILSLLDKSPSVELYIQAGHLASRQNKPISRINGFFNQAYALGNKREQSRAALYAAIGALKSKKTKNVAQWVAKIHDGDHNFDKYILQALLAAEGENWQQMRQNIQKANHLEEKKGLFFNQEHLHGLQTDYVMMALPPEQALDELTTLLEQETELGYHTNRISQLHYTRGLLLSDKLNRPEDAIEDLTKYLALNPSDAKAQNALGYTLLSIEGKIDEAFILLQTAYQSEPESPAINDSIGWAYYLKGDAKTALPYLEYAYEQMNEAEIGAHLGEVLWALKEYDEAKLVWHEAWKKDANNRALKEALEKYRVRF